MFVLWSCMIELPPAALYDTNVRICFCFSWRTPSGPVNAPIVLRTVATATSSVAKRTSISSGTADTPSKHQLLILNRSRKKAPKAT